MTICAISTPPGVGGIAVIRVSGPDAVKAVDSLWKGKSLAEVASHTVHLGQIMQPSGEVLDQAVATVFRAPHSFTGENVVEIAVHGSEYIQHQLLALLIDRGCRLADPGEFTRRAFTAGRMDLAQAEAVADVIAAKGRAAHRLAMQQMKGGFSQRLRELREKLLELASLLELELDFSEEDVEFADRSRLTALAQEVKAEVDRLAGSFAAGNAILNGVPVAIAGAPNVGKSSLLNTLLGDDRAIVSDIPGTTRDTVEDTIDIEGITFRFIDTAGLRSSNDPVERLGMERSHAALRRARIILHLRPAVEEIVTGAGQLAGEDNVADIMKYAAPDATVINLLTKADLLGVVPETGASSTISEGSESLLISSRTGLGISELRHLLANAATGGTDSSEILVTNVRHAVSLRSASASLDRFLSALSDGLPTDLAAQDLREALHHLGAITGTVTTPDILSTIFSRFCIGK